jgi:hypothetical protein
MIRVLLPFHFNLLFINIVFVNINMYCRQRFFFLSIFVNPFVTDSNKNVHSYLHFIFLNGYIQQKVMNMLESPRCLLCIHILNLVVNTDFMKTINKMKQE